MKQRHKRTDDNNAPKDRRLEIRMSVVELELCQAIAAREGYATGAWARELIVAKARDLKARELVRRKPAPKLPPVKKKAPKR